MKKIVSLSLALVGIVFLALFAWISLASSSNTAPVVRDIDFSQTDQVYNLVLSLRDEDRDDTVLSLSLVSDNATYKISVDDVNLSSSLGASPEVNNQAEYQIGTDLKPIQTSLGDLSLTLIWDMSVENLPATADISDYQLRAVLSDGEEQSEEYLLDFNEEKTSTSSSQHEVLENQTIYLKPEISSLSWEYTDDDLIEIGFIASGGVDNLAAIVQYQDLNSQWQKVNLSEVEASNPVPEEFADIGLSSGTYQITGIHTKAGDNNITAKWDYKSELGLNQEGDFYLEIILVNLLSSSEPEQLGPIFVDTKAPVAIDDLIALEGMRSSEMDLSWTAKEDETISEDDSYVLVTDIDSGLSVGQVLDGQAIREGHFTIVGLSENKDYEFQLFFIDKSGNQSLSNIISGNTNSLPEISRIQVYELDDENSLEFSLKFRDLDAAESTIRNKLQLAVKYNYNGQESNASIKSVESPDQPSKVLIDNLADFQMGQLGAYIKASDDWRELSFVWDTAADLPGLIIDDLQLCLTVGDLVDQSVPSCLYDIAIDNSNVQIAAKAEPIIEAIVFTTPAVEEQVPEEEFHLSHTKEPFIKDFLAKIGINNSYIIEDFYSAEGEDLIFNNVDAAITRVDAVRFALMLSGVKIMQPNMDVFHDVSRESSYSNYVFTAKKMAMIGGQGQGEVKIQKYFNSQGQINLAEALAMILRAYEIKVPAINNTVLAIEYGIDSIPYDFDISKENKVWYADNMVYAYVNGVISDKVKPDQVMTIADFVELLIKVNAVR